MFFLDVGGISPHRQQVDFGVFGGQMSVIISIVERQVDTSVYLLKVNAEQGRRVPVSCSVWFYSVVLFFSFSHASMMRRAMESFSGSCGRWSM